MKKIHPDTARLNWLLSCEYNISVGKCAKVVNRRWIDGEIRVARNPTLKKWRRQLEIVSLLAKRFEALGMPAAYQLKQLEAGALIRSIDSKTASLRSGRRYNHG